MSARIIKLMPDYYCHTLWDVETSANIMPSKLPLSQTTVDRLQRWAKDYDNTLHTIDPINSGFSSPELELSFEKDGRSLWLQLIAALGNAYKVHYFSNKHQKVLENPEEYDRLNNCTE